MESYRLAGLQPSDWRRQANGMGQEGATRIGGQADWAMRRAAAMSATTKTWTGSSPRTVGLKFMNLTFG